MRASKPSRLSTALEALLDLLRDRLLRNAGYLVGVTALNAGAGFIFWNLAARLYPPEDVGLASATLSIASLVAGIGGLGLGVGLVRFLPESLRPVRLVNGVLTLTALVALAGGGIYLLGVRVWSPSLAVLREQPVTLVGFLALVVATALGAQLQAAFLAVRKVQYSLWQNTVMNGVRLALVATIAAAGARGVAASVAIGVVAGDLLALWVFLPRAVPHYRPELRWSPRWFRRLVPYSAANYAADLLYRAPVLLAPLLVLEQLGAAASAHAYVAWMIGLMLTSPALALASSSFAEGSHAPDELRRLLLHAGRYALGVTVPLALVAFAGAPRILGLFGPSYAGDGAGLLRWLALAAPLTAFVGLYFAALRVRRRLGEQLALSAIVMAVTLGTIAATLGRLGLAGIGAGWLAGHALVAGFAAILLYRLRRRPAVPESEEVVMQAVAEVGEVVVAIPCFNEADFIGDVVRRAQPYAGRVIVVDDGSTDGTDETARAAGAEVVRHPQNRGPGAAARSCFEAARRLGAAVLVTLDGDGQHDPAEIADVAGPVLGGEADLVIGSRFLGKSNNVARYRRFGIDVITFLYNVGVREHITDGQSCFRAYGRRALETLRITEDGFGFSVETLVQARRAGLRIREASISCVYHEQSHSANPVIHGVGVALMVVKHRLTKPRGNGNPS